MLMKRRLTRLLLFADCQEKSIAHVSQPWLQHTFLRELRVNPSDPNLGTLWPLLRDCLHTFLCADDGQDEDALGAPFAEGGYRSGTGAACRDNRVYNDGEAAGRRGRAGVGIRDVVWEVVVVFDGVEGGWFAIHAEMVDRDWVG